uniref:Uncharacterized protein n=1 Tax=Grapevine virus L TaxID=2283237 RepID=A0A5P1I5U5_9VIRU|nr:hypothetical protein [Grapevine virus L]
MIHGRELVKSRYTLDTLVLFNNRLVIEGKCVPDGLFNPLYMLTPGSEREIVREQIKWQLGEHQEALEFRIQQVGREPHNTGAYKNGSLSDLFLYSRFDKVDLEAMLAFLGGPYLDSCYISEQDGKCTLKSHAGHMQVVNTTLEHTVGIIGKLEGLVVINNSPWLVRTLQIWELFM